MLNLVKHRIKELAYLNGNPADLAGLRFRDRRMMTRVRNQNLTYLTPTMLGGLSRTVRAIVDARLPGIFVEAGCALGGSAIMIASIKEDERPFYVYDVFGVIPAPTSDDTPDVHDRYKAILDGKSTGINGDQYYGYQKNLYDVVQLNFLRMGISCERHSVSLVKGMVQDTMRIDGPVAFAHIDVDWYEPVMTCLERIFPRLVPGGSIILDDYLYWGGCKKATDEYLKTVAGKFSTDDSAGTLKVTRIKN